MDRLAPHKTCVLQPFEQVVESVMFFKNSHDSDNQQVLFEASPEGVFELVFQQGNTVWQKAQHDSVWQQRDDAFVGGLHQQSYQVKLTPGAEIISVRFRPGAFKYVFAGRLNDFINAKVPVSEVWSDQGRRLSATISQQTNCADQLQAIAGFIQSRMDQSRRSVIDDAVSQVIQSEGRLTVAQLEQMVPLSQAQFRKRFREEVGLAPKKFTQIIRINAILNALQSVRSGSHLVDLAYQFNYFDQSHFIKDFKSVVGKTPRQYEQAVT
jgi:AraC-like DNA-binding protein